MQDRYEHKNRRKYNQMGLLPVVLVKYLLLLLKSI